MCMCRSTYTDHGLSPQIAERYCPHFDYMEVNEVVIHVDVDGGRKDYLPYPGGAYEDDEEPPP